MTSGSGIPSAIGSAVAVVGRLQPLAEARGHARFICHLTFGPALPAAVEIVQLFQGEERQVLFSLSSLRVREPANAEASNEVFEIETEVDASHVPLVAIRVFTIAQNGTRSEVEYGEDYFAQQLFFRTKREFERGFFIRRRRAKDEATLLFCAEQLIDHYRLSAAHRAVAAVVYGYRAIDLADRWRGSRALSAVDDAFEAAGALESTRHPRTDRDHLLQSLQMARWQLQVFLLDELGLMRTLVAAVLRTTKLEQPLAINTYNGCRMYMVCGFLLHKAALTTLSREVFETGIAFFAQAMENEAQRPNQEWAFPQSDVDETQRVVDRMARFAERLVGGAQDLGEQDDVVLSATRLLQAESREAMRRNFARLVGRIAKVTNEREEWVAALVNFPGAAGDDAGTMRQDHRQGLIAGVGGQGDGTA